MSKTIVVLILTISFFTCLFEYYFLKAKINNILNTYSTINESIKNIGNAITDIKMNHPVKTIEYKNGNVIELFAAVDVNQEIVCDNREYAMELVYKTMINDLSNEIAQSIEIIETYDVRRNVTNYRGRLRIVK